MFSWLSNAWRVPEIRRRLLFTAFVLAIYRLGSWIPSPGVDSAAIDSYLSRTGGIFNLLNLFSGGALSQFSIFALGLGFFWILLDSNRERQAWHDQIAGTLVVKVPRDLPLP